MMKKCIILLLVFMMIVPEISLAIDENQIPGTWVNIFESSDGDYFITLYNFFPDHTVYFLSKEVDTGVIDPGIEAIYKWTLDNDEITIWKDDVHHVTITYSQKDNVLIDSGFQYSLIYSRYNFSWINGKTSKTTKSAAPVESSFDSIESGLLLYPGQYIIGEDLPAGSYRFELYQYESDIYIRRDPDAALWRAFASVTEKSPVYAKLTVFDGERLDVVAFPVIIMYAKQIAPAGD